MSNDKKLFAAKIPKVPLVKMLFTPAPSALAHYANWISQPKVLLRWALFLRRGHPSECCKI